MSDWRERARAEAKIGFAEAERLIREGEEAARAAETVVRCLDSFELADGTVEYFWTRWLIQQWGDRTCLGLDYDVQASSRSW